MLKINCKTRCLSEFSDYIQINCIMSREKVSNLIFSQLFCRTLSRRYSKRNDDGETN